MNQGDISKGVAGSMLQKLLHIGSTAADDEATVVGIGGQGFLGGLPVGVQRGDHELLDKREEMLNELRDDYFTGEMDAVELELGELGPDVESRDLTRVADERSAVLDAVSEKMSGRILREYDTLREALEEIGCIEESVGAAKLHIKVSREQLASASVEVRHGIAVWQNAQKKRNMSATVDLMNKIKSAKDFLPLIREEMENEEYGLAVEHCVASAEAAAVLFPLGIQAADIISDRANDLLCSVDDQMFHSLSSMTTRFDPERYQKVLKGYQLLTDPERVIGAGEVQPGQDIVSAYCNAPMMKAKKILLGVVAGKAGANGTESSRDLPLEDLGIPDLMARVPSGAIKVCIGQVLRVQFEILQSYSNLEKWHRARQDQKLEGSSMKKLQQGLEKSLPRGRGLVWNEISRCLSMILQGSKLTQSENFLVVSRWIVQFAEVGASFSGESPLALQSLLRQQTLKFFEGFHDNSIESLYLLLENEKFNLITVTLPWKVDVEEAKSKTKPNESVGRVSLDECLSSMGNPWDTSLEDAKFDMLSDMKSLIQGSGIMLGDGKRFQATNASWRLIKRLLEYATLMKNLPAAAAAIFFKLTELVDLYLLHIFMVFIDDNMFLEDSEMYQDLYECIKIIINGSLSKHVSILRAANPTSHIAEVLDTGIPAGHSSTNKLSPRKAPQSPSISNSGNLYGLVERIVVSKTMNDVTSLIVQLGPILTELLPDSDSYSVGEFINRVTNSIEALESGIYKRGCSLMLPLAWLPAAVSSSTYQLSEPPSTAAPWTLQLKRQLELLCAQLSSVPDMKPEILSLFWKYVYPAVSSAIVDGLSQVRKCTLEGRAAMSLDLQAVGRVLHQTCPEKMDQTRLSNDSNRAIRYIDDYIKGFYVPLSELHSWAESHQSYAQSQVMALAACIAESSGFKKKDVAIALMELEENLQRLQRRSGKTNVVETKSSPQEINNQSEVGARQS
eukprot:jgi/Picsp_1/3282/NSC_06122-R1_coiled-coil domain-containing protein 132 isoform 1